MKKYIGCVAMVLKAEPMSMNDFGRKFKGTTPADTDLDQYGYHVKYPDGHDSWFPKDIFESVYRRFTEGEVDFLIEPVDDESEENS